MYEISKNMLSEYSNIYKYFVNIFLEMSYITLYLANFWFQSQIATIKFRCYNISKVTLFSDWVISYIIANLSSIVYISSE